ncbi:MAG: hypothetical protein Q8P61_04265 [Candidatus Nanopelagicales bacterium]|nr:hypothetical protein [Candidatus Nanopelagicales bacterium]
MKRKTVGLTAAGLVLATASLGLGIGPSAAEGAVISSPTTVSVSAGSDAGFGTTAGELVARGAGANKRKKTKKKRRREPLVRRADSPHRFGTVAYSKWYARAYMARKYGWGKGEFSALARLWHYESRWGHRVMNSSSGAYGIPQALPGSKMSSAGSDWATNPETQIRWGLGYIKQRYGTPSRAYSFFRSHNWY